ncbi:hypothetical protein P7C70_g7812, partial [Phenoliferia sp. Uapishka_3]
MLKALGATETKPRMTAEPVEDDLDVKPTRAEMLASLISHADPLVLVKEAIDEGDDTVCGRDGAIVADAGDIPVMQMSSRWIRSLVSEIRSWLGNVSLPESEKPAGIWTVI